MPLVCFKHWKNLKCDKGQTSVCRSLVTGAGGEEVEEEEKLMSAVMSAHSQVSPEVQGSKEATLAICHKILHEFP